MPAERVALDEQPIIDFLLWMDRSKRASSASTDSYGSTLRTFARFAPKMLNGPTSWGDVQPHHVEAFGDRERRGGGNGTPGSIRTGNAHLTEFYKWMGREGWVSDTPMPDVARPKIAAVDGESLALPDSVFTAVWSAQLALDNRFWIGLASILGLRVSEIASLRPHDVDIKRGVILGIARKGNKRMGLEYREHALMMEEELPLVYQGAVEWSKLLERMARQREGERYLTPFDRPATHKERQSHGKLDAQWEGWPSPRKMNAELGYILRDLDIEDRFTPHAFRHTAATNMLRTGMDITLVAQILGHDSTATTARYDRAEARLEEFYELRKARRKKS
jgi:site-specific recombinase XerD